MRNLESDNYWCWLSCSVLSESACRFFWPFPHQLKTLLQLQAMCYLHLRQEEEMAGRQFPDISISVSGKANIFLEILWQTSAYVSLARTDHWPSLALLSGRWQERRRLAKTIEFPNKPWGMVLICYDSEESNSNKQIAIVIASLGQTWTC